MQKKTDTSQYATKLNQDESIADNSHSFTLTNIVTFFDAIAMGMIMPVIPLVLITMGASPTQITFHLVMFSIGALLFAPIMGAWGDKSDHVKIIRFAIIVSAIAIFGLYAVSTWYAFLIFRFVQGIGSTKEAILYAFAVSNDFGRSKPSIIAAVGASRLAGLFVGPVLGGIIAHRYNETNFGFYTVFLLSFLFTLSSFMVSMFFRKNNRRETRNTISKNINMTSTRFIFTSFAISNLSAPVVFNVVIGASMGIVMSITVLTLKTVFELNAAVIGLTLGILTLVVASCRIFVSGFIIEKYNISVSVPCMIGLVGAFMAGMALSTTAAYFIFFLLCAGAVMGSLDVAIGVMFERSSTPENKGTIFGILSTTTAVGQIISASVSGLLFDRLSYSAPFWLSSILLTACFLGYMVFTLIRRQTPEA